MNASRFRPNRKSGLGGADGAAVEAVLRELLEPTSHSVLVGPTDQQLRSVVCDLAPEGHHVLLEPTEQSLESLEDHVDPRRAVRLIVTTVDGEQLGGLRDARSLLTRARPYVLFRCRDTTVVSSLYDLLRGCGLFVTTVRQWESSGHSARIDREEFQTAVEAAPDSPFLAHSGGRPCDLPTPQDGLVTVVVPTLNEEAAIDACLESIRGQEYRQLEIFVVDGGSHDRTREHVLRHADRDERVRLIPNEDQIIPAALNRALWAASGQWLVRIDAHSSIPTDYVRRLVDHLRTGRWGGVGGRKDGVSTNATGRAIAEALGSPFGVGNSVYHHGRTVQSVDHLAYGAYPVEVARHVGGWNERLVANEDYEFDHRVLRAGFELLFDPAISVRWVSQQRLRGLGRQYRRYGRAKAQVMQLSPGSTKYRHLVAPALVAWTGLAALISVRRPRTGVAMMAPYATAVSTAAALAARRVPATVAIRMAPAFVTMHMAWGFGWWERMVLGRSAAAATARH